MNPNVFRKTRSGAPPGYYQAEAAGLEWITVLGGPPVPTVIRTQRDALELTFITARTPDVLAAEDFGRRLTVLHNASAIGFGQGPPDAPHEGWIADLKMPYGSFSTFGEMYAQLRVVPYVEMGRTRGLFGTGDLGVFGKLIELLGSGDSELVGPPEPPARLHGDLWSGNLMWSEAKGEPGVWLVDPAAYSGHRETDLAMLALFGAPHLERILAAYHEAAPLADGWRERVPLHQVYPLLVHAVLFGGGYVRQAVHAAKAAARS